VLKATLRGFLAHRGRLLMSALAVVLSVAFVAGSLVFSDTVSRTFDRLFASTAADVSVTPRQDLRSPVPTGVVRTLPADLARRVAEVPGVAAVQLDVVVRNATVVDRRNRPVGPATGSPITVRNWEETGRNPLRLASGRPPRGDGEAVLDADTAGRQHVRLGDPLSVQAQPGTFRVRVVGIAAFTTTNPGSALVCATRRSRSGGCWAPRPARPGSPSRQRRE